METTLQNRINGHSPSLAGLPVPPHSTDAERAVLACLMLDETGTAFDAVAAIIGPNDFYHSHHAAIYRAACELFEANQAIDAVLLWESLEADGMLEEIGGPQEIESLVMATGSPAHAEYYAKIVHEKSGLRRAIRKAQQFTRAAFERQHEPEQLQAEYPEFFKSRDEKIIRPISLGKLVEESGGLRQPVVHGLIRKGEVCNIVAPSKLGKSWGVYGLALSIATGQNWLDRFRCEPGRVLLLDNELHHELLASRIPIVAEAMGLKPESYQEKIDVISLRGRLKDIYEISPMIQRIPARKYSAIIFDAWYRMLPAKTDENSNANVSHIFNQLDRYARETDAAILCVHHSSKGSQGEKSIVDVGAGAGSQSRAADTHIILREHEEDGHVVLDAAVRSWEPVEPLVLSWQFPLWVPCRDVDPGKLKGRLTKGETRQAERDRDGMESVLKVLRAAGKPLTTRNIRDLTGIGADRLSQLLAMLTAAKTIKSEPTRIRGNDTFEYSIIEHK
ncbi:MAG: hypothetical protein Tsb009_36230 [Planctomycetaceae bacterium]